MKIFHYRNPDYDADPWNDAIINGNTNLNDFCPKTILSINGCNILRQHYSTYITGKNTSNAHHFAKMIAAAVLKGSFTLAPGLSVDLQQSQQGTVLWVDSVHSVHACADFFKEMITNFDPDNKNFYLFSLNRLGTFRYDFYALLNCFEKAVRETNPTLIVIDDIDHLMPYCGINVASAFNHAIRDILNHTATTCLFIGYNHLGKRASTTGNVGNMLFSEAHNIITVSTQQSISTVKYVKSFNAQTDHNAFFHFTIGQDNLPHEVMKTMVEPTQTEYMKQTTLRDIISEVIKPGQSISPDELFQQLNSRRLQLNRYDRTRALIAQAAQLGIIHKPDPSSNNYTLITPIDATQPDFPRVSESHKDALEGCDSSTSHTPASDGNDDNSANVNNSLTLPPHPPIEKGMSSITGCQPVTPPAVPIPSGSPVP